MSRLSVFLLFLAIVVCQGTRNNTINYYKDILCNTTENGQYDCSFLDDLKKDKCYFAGEKYDLGQELPKELLNREAKCKVSCNCHMDHFENAAVWNCLNIECPEHFGLIPGRSYTYSHDKCCALISDKDPSVTEDTKCMYHGKEYYKGQRFYPEEEPCLSCICDKGFKGELKEPWCQRIKCNTFLHYLSKVRNHCIPLFTSSNGCCAIYDFRCPSEDDAVITHKNIELNQLPEAPKCKFGNLELFVGQSLSPKKLAGSCTDCTCSVPPVVTCHMTDCN
ncbi:uncharacterized protein LOC106670289 [Cimex lectularius]|uniref:VWFC domain-containing protein n=1 Tax=Cimex lectularius TaxID=79782 RepID=A0A8I6TJK4_CIMLE|nr:uncharacterized protein LOC106670289 [Cimex lectularius]